LIFPLWKELRKTAQRKNLLSGYKWAQDMGHGMGGGDWGSQSLSLSESQSGTGDRVSTAEQSAVASVPKHEKFSAAAAVRCSCR